MIIPDGDYWIGLTDLYEGHFRWTFDQSKTTFTKWVNGYGSKGTSSNCVSYNTAGKAEWFDNSCYNTRPFVCETNYCKYFCIMSRLLRNISLFYFVYFYTFACLKLENSVVIPKIKCIVLMM